VVTSM